MDNTIIETLFEKEMMATETKTEYVTYGELAKKVGTMTLCEEMDRRYRDYINMRDRNIQGLSQEEINLLVNVYHWYIITKEAAEFLQKETDEVVYTVFQRIAKSITNFCTKSIVLPPPNIVP